MKEINKGDIWMTLSGIVQVCSPDRINGHDSIYGYKCRISGSKFQYWIAEDLFMYKISK